MAIVTASGMSKTTGKVANSNKALVFKKGDAYAPEGSLGKVSAKNPAKQKNSTAQNPITPSLASLTGANNAVGVQSPIQNQFTLNGGYDFGSGPLTKTSPIVNSPLYGPAKPNPVPFSSPAAPYQLQTLNKYADTVPQGIPKEYDWFSRSGTFTQQNTNQNSFGPSPDVQIQQAQGWAKDDIRFQEATFAAQNFGTLPDNIPTWWANDWQLTPEQMSQMGYTLLGSNLWIRGGSGSSGGSGYGGSGGGRGGGGRGGGTGRSGYTNTSGYSSDQIFNWRLASG